ncbi:hypothetical protein IPH70_02280 [Candidatus Roizmanbacteria bacterium]|nr:MAG: hypothetical protein IPH70_02280 [Candidatus Roizmanbacteria bacterium]
MLLQKNARVDYRLPETIRDYWNQENRTQSARALLRRSYGSIVDDEWRIPLRDYVRAILPVFMKYPIEALYFKFVIKLYHKLKIRNRKNWVLALSTKNYEYRFKHKTTHCCIYWSLRSYAF